MEQDVHAPTLDARGVAFPGTNLYVQLGRGARLRLERHLGRPGHHRHVRAAAVPTRAPLQVPRQVPADRDADPHELVAADGRRLDARRHAETLTAERTKLGIVTARAHDQGQAGDLHAAAHDLRPRDRLRPRLLLLQRPGQGARREELPAGREPDRLHVQLVLRRRPQDRVLQLGLQPEAGAADRPELPGLGPVRVARHDDRREHPPAGREPELPHELEQQAGAGHARRRRQLGLRADVPVEDARRPRQARDGGRAQDRSRGAGAGDGGRRHRRPARRRRAAVGAEGRRPARATPRSPPPWGSCALGTRSGAHRIDRDGDGRYDDAAPIQIMDAWWPLLVRAEFEPVLGRSCSRRSRA